MSVRGNNIRKIINKLIDLELMDEEGEIALKVEGGKHLKENYVGAHIKNYDSMLMLSHFKGHAMGGLGSREYEIVNLD